MIDTASGMRARSLLRRHITATIALGVFAGIAGGVALGAWAAGRRTATSYDRFLAYENASTYTIFSCPLGVSIDGPDADRCRTSDQADVLDYVRTIPGVESAGRWSFALAAVAPVDRPDDWARVLVPFALDLDAVEPMGRPIVVDGRLADQGRADEVVINEAMATGADVGVGDDIVVTVASADEFEAAGEALQRPTGTSTTMHVVGIIRRPGDLMVRASDGGQVDNLARVEATQAWAGVLGDDYARYGIGVLVRSRELGPDDVVAAIGRHWPGRGATAIDGPPTVARDPVSIVDAIALQATATRLLAAVIGAAVVVFVGQALSRQSRREWGDAGPLAALGMTRTGMVRAAAWRALPIAAISAAVAFVVLVASSPLGPVGVARNAETAPGVHLDSLVAAVGIPVIAAITMLFAVVPIARLRRGIDLARRDANARVPGTTISPALGAGLAMTRSRRAGGLALGSAIAGVALAAATGVAAWQLTSSYDALVATPARYGAAWDALVGNVTTDAQQADTVRRLDAVPGIRAARILSLSGEGPDPGLTIIAGVPVVGEVSFGVVTAGRPPVRSDEVALGRDTMRDLHVGIGDSIALPPEGGDSARRFDVVGEAVINDGFEAQPGVGALVTPDAFADLAPSGDGSVYAVWVDDDVDRASTLATLRAAFPTTFTEPRPTNEIANLRLVENQPKLLTLVVGLLAGAALVHALVTSVRRSRRQIGVLKTLGFTRGQVVTSVGWHATTIAVIALVVGLPLGAVAGRLAWRAISNSLGVATVQSLPLLAIATIAALVLLVANIAAFAPGVWAARTRPASTLRAE